MQSWEKYKAIISFCEKGKKYLIKNSSIEIRIERNVEEDLELVKKNYNEAKRIKDLFD